MKKRWIFGVLTVAFLWLVVSRYSQIEALQRTLAGGRWEWVLAAALTQVVYYTVFAASYKAALRAVDVPSRLRDLLPVTLSSIFVNVAAPSGGAAGAAVFVDDMRHRGQPPARVAVGVFLQLVSDYAAIIIILVFGIYYLFTQHDLQVYQIVAAIILFVINLALSGALLLSLWRPTLLHRLLHGLQRILNGVFGLLRVSTQLAEGWAERNAAEFSVAASAAAERPGRVAETVWINFLAHLINISSLYMLFLAFNQPVKAGALIAGYSMGMLFLIVSVTPMGIGVVEGAMTLVFASLGVPTETAAAVTLSFRGLTFWLPLLLGFLLLRRVKTFGAGERSLGETWEIRLAAILTFTLGVVNMLSAVTPALASRLALAEKILPRLVLHGSRLATALAGFALILLADGLRRRKSIAWTAAMITLAISGAAHLVKGIDYEEALLSAGMMYILWRSRHHFHARSDPPSVQRAAELLPAAALFTIAYGTLGFYLLDRHYSVNFGFWAALRQTVIMFTSFSDPGLTPITGFGTYFADSIYIVGSVTIATAALLLLRPMLLRQPATSEERLRAREIVENYGRTSLARYTLFNDKAYYFSPGGSVIAFTVRQRAAVALGDPIGPQEDALAAIQGYIKFCSTNDWTPVFYQTQPDYLFAYQQAGFKNVCVGHEAIVDLSKFTLEGKTGKQFRTSINKLTREGYHFEIYLPPIDAVLLDELRAVSNEWLTTMHGSEKRFSLGWFDDEYLRGSIIAAIIDSDGAVSAFANLTTEYQHNETSVDLMRRRDDAPSGTMDYLFANILQWAKKQGYATFNLGLSALAGVGEHSEDQAAERVMHFIYEHINQFYNFKGLHEFKEKFEPDWSPRYLVYPGALEIGRAWLAVVDANSGR